jgi:aerotaxis receptor
VEAARAGEQGRGFAVVASEVRALAQKTTAAAGEVKGVIAESSKWVDAGTKTTGQARQRMTEALASVDKMNALLNEISIATSEQQDGIEEINQAMVQLDGLTQQNAAMVEELAAAASSAEGQMEGVSNSMRLFRLTGGEVSLAQVDAVALRREARDIPALPDQAVQAGHVAQAVQAARMAASAPRLPGA